MLSFFAPDMFSACHGSLIISDFKLELLWDQLIQNHTPHAATHIVQKRQPHWIIWRACSFLSKKHMENFFFYRAFIQC
jgi:hypothetical protein